MEGEINVDYCHMNFTETSMQLDSGLGKFWKVLSGKKIVKFLYAHYRHSTIFSRIKISLDFYLRRHLFDIKIHSNETILLDC